MPLWAESKRTIETFDEASNLAQRQTDTGRLQAHDGTQNFRPLELVINAPNSSPAICSKMSKFGVLVMGPAGAGKVCTANNSLITRIYIYIYIYTSTGLTVLTKPPPLDDLLQCPDPAPPDQPAVMFLRQSRPSR